MSTTLDTVVSEVRKQPADTQEVVGRFMRASLAGEQVTLAEIEEQYRIEHTLKGLAEAERGEGVPAEEAFARIRAALYGEKQS